ncbi:MAG: TPM domain-containing protein [Treponema sp.]|nr:TPM domain-containing protein [Treponema sp.]
MKKFVTLLLASFMFLVPLTAQEDVIPLSIEDSDDYYSIEEDFQDLLSEVNALLVSLGEDELPADADLDDVIEVLDKYGLLDEDESGDGLYLDDGASSVVTTGYDDDEDLSALRLYLNEETGFEAYIADDAGLLSEKEKDALLNDLIPITQWGNACFFTSDKNYGVSTEELAAEFYEQLYEPDTSGTIFLVDMNERMLWIHSEGEVYKTINDNYAQTITDNVYKLASASDYYGCASKVFGQIGTLLSGGKIAQPMKHISNYLLALILALIICFIYMKSSSKTQDEKAQPKAEPIFNGTLANISVTKGRLTSRTIQSSSGGGSRGGGGGGHSGGGGGHRF